MAKSFKKLVDRLPLDRQEKIREGTKVLLSEMALQELRKALELTQNQLATNLDVNQAAVSKIERQSDMYVSTLRRFLEAMGAELKVIASFPDREIVINQFEDL